MIRKHFINALDNYIINDQMQSVVKLIEKSTQLRVHTILSILDNVDKDRLITATRTHSFQHTHKCINHTLGHLIYTELMNDRKRYIFSGRVMEYRIQKFNFKRHFEHI